MSSGVPESLAGWPRRTRALLAVAARFALCAMAAWLAALLLELADIDASLRRVPGRFGYLSEVALACSLLWLPVLGLLHALRWLLKSRVRRADLLLCALLAAAIALPSQRRAQLLTGGTGMLDAPDELLVRIAIAAALVAGYLAVWAIHLMLCRMPQRDGALERRSRWRRLASAAAFVLGTTAVIGFAYAVNEKLRAYAFLVSFLMPGAWLFGASLWYGSLIRSPRTSLWTTLSVAFVFGGVAYGFENEAAVRHAKAELIRRGGLAALSEAARHFAPPPGYATLALDRPDRFRCPPAPARATVATGHEHRRNVIFISVDSFRRDALGRTVGGRPLTPALDGFARESMSFERAITPYPATLFALGGTLTGLYPSELLLAPPTLPDVLQLTASSWDARIAIWPDVVWFRRSALPRLITRSLGASLWPGAAEQTDKMIHELRDARARGKRTFAWIHYYEPHQMLSKESRDLGERPRERYDALVGLVDREIARLLDTLKSLGYYDDSLIAVFGDHGEAIGELGYYGHHVYLNHFIGDIPLMIRAPGLTPGTSQQLASLTDLAPTLLEWTGTTAPALASDARSLFELARSTDDRYGLSEAFPVRGRLLYELVREPITSEAGLRDRWSLVRSGSADYQPKVALVGSRYRLIVNRVTGDEEFYDRVNDPAERDDLSDRELPEHRRMRRELATVVRRMSERIHCRVAALPEPPATK